jgi:hypothetical protein
MSSVPLDRLQQWMQAVVVHPGRVEDAVATAPAVELVPDVARVILPSASLSPVERVGIYHGMYLLRMEEALQSDYPGLQHFLGPERFRRLVADYVQAYPSRSYTLNRLGDHLPAFLRTCRSVPRPAFCADLATLELAMTEAFDAEETPSLTAEDVAPIPADAWAGAVLRPVASLRLVALRYPVAGWLDATHEGEHDHPAIRRADTFMVVYRRAYQVYRQDVPREAFELLGMLVAGLTLGDAVASLLKKRRRVDPDVLFRFFREWMASGLFRTLELPPG